MIHQNVAWFVHAVIKRKDLPSDITCRFQLIRSSEPAGSIDESWHLVLYPMASSIELLPTNESIATKGPRVYNSSAIWIAKCRRNRVVGLVVVGTNGMETLFFTFKVFHLKRLPSEEAKTATVKNGTKRGHWKEKRDRKVTRKAEATWSDSTLD